MASNLDSDPDLNPWATLPTLRSLRFDIARIAADNGITNLRVTPDGRLYGRVDHSRPYSGLLSFDADLAERLGIRVFFVSDSALANEGNDDQRLLFPLDADPIPDIPMADAG